MRMRALALAGLLTHLSSLGATQSFEDTDFGTDKALHDELRRMMELDQDLIERKQSSDSPALAKELDRQIRADTARLKAIVAAKGWPGKSLVGHYGTIAAWLIIQHSEDVEFQERCRDLMKPLAANGEIPPQHLAFLTDRILVKRGKKQIYGSQFQPRTDGGVAGPYPIEDPANVNARRQAVGLEPLSEYTSFMQATNPAKTKR